MSLDICGAQTRAATESAGKWEIKPGLSPHLSMKDNAAAAQNPVVVFAYSKPAVRIPCVRWATQADLNDPEKCAIMDLVGIDKNMRDAAKAQFATPQKPVLVYSRDEETQSRQMAAEQPPAFQMKG